MKGIDVLTMPREELFLPRGKAVRREENEKEKEEENEDKHT